jgi:hypothetical protein
VLLHDGDTGSVIAVYVTREDVTWCIECRPALQVVGCAGTPLCLHFSRPTAGAEAEERLIMCTSHSLPLCLGTPRSGKLRVWLGAPGWSIPLAISKMQPGVQVLYPDPLPRQSQPPLPPEEYDACSCHADSIALYVPENHTGNGQVELIFFHPVQLENKLFVDINVAIPGSMGRPLALSPGSSMPLPIPKASGELVRILTDSGSDVDGSGGPIIVAPAFHGGFNFETFDPDLWHSMIGLPQPGHAAALMLPCPAEHAGGVAASACVLMTTQPEASLPLFRLSIMPQLTVRNCLPSALTFEVHFLLT